MRPDLDKWDLYGVYIYISVKGRVYILGEATFSPWFKFVSPQSLYLTIFIPYPNDIRLLLKIPTYG